MKLEFIIKDNHIERKDSNLITEKDFKDIICEFSFLDKKWKKKEKYIIFWNSKNKSEIMSLGKGNKAQCTIPFIFLQKSIFDIQVYINDNIKTQKLKIGITPSIIEKEKTNNTCNKEQKTKDDPYNIKNFIENVSEELESKIDKIIYENGYLKCLCENKIVYSQPLAQDLKNDIQKLIQKADSKIDNISINQDTITCYSKDKIIYDIPFTNVFSDVAWTGDYNDLKNIPNEFNPSYHNHVVVDVIDYEENIDTDLNTLLDFLTDEINKE